MNRHKLTQRNLEIDTRAKIQILLFVIFIPLLAITGRAQEPEEQAKDQDHQK
jgi:hypothetical protein